jgi:ABC-type multidrug transport system ATPase subunit
LARCLYQDCDIYLLDDILSSVDVNVANQIFSKAILNFLKKRGKTVIMCLSQYKYLQHADKTILMNKGTPLEGSQYLESFLSTMQPVSKSSKDLPDSKDSTSSEFKTKSEGPAPVDVMAELEKREEGEIKFKTVKLFVNGMGLHMFLAILLGGFLM